MNIERRIEQKFLRNNNASNSFLIKNSKNLEVIYPERKVFSLYYDTSDFLLYKNSIYKDYDKYKVRFRNYYDSNNINKEVKLTNKSGKYKIVTSTNYKNFNEIENFFYKGNYLKPSLKVEYVRNYYEYKGNRLTVDTEIKFSHPMFKNHCSDLIDVTVFEIKYLNNNSDDFFLQYPVFSALKFSKYEEGIKKIYLS